MVRISARSGRHFPVEVSKFRRGLLGVAARELHDDINSARATVPFAELATAPVVRIPLSGPMPEAWGRRGHLTIADALYIVLAEHLGAPLVTTDERLAGSPGLSVATITANHG